MYNVFIKYLVKFNGFVTSIIPFFFGYRAKTIWRPSDINISIDIVTTHAPTEKLTSQKYKIIKISLHIYRIPFVISNMGNKKY